MASMGSDVHQLVLEGWGESPLQQHARPCFHASGRRRQGGYEEHAHRLAGVVFGRLGGGFGVRRGGGSHGWGDPLLAARESTILWRANTNARTKKYPQSPSKGPAAFRASPFIPCASSAPTAAAPRK